MKNEKTFRNQQVSEESELANAKSKPVPIRAQETELKNRLIEVVSASVDEGISQSEFARRCDISESLLRKYLGGAEPSTLRLVAIADTAGVNVLWLATGRGPKQGAAPSQVQQQAIQAAPAPALDVARLTRALQAVQEGLQAIGRTLPPAKHAELVTAAYELLESPATSASNVIRFIKAAA